MKAIPINCTLDFCATSDKRPRVVVEYEIVDDLEQDQKQELQLEGYRAELPPVKLEKK